MTGPCRIGLDLGGSKIAAIALDGDKVRFEARTATPRDDYAATIRALAEMTQAARLEAGDCTVGVGIPGSISPRTGLVHNANSTWLNGRALDRDLAEALGQPVRIANDADCFALSEATDGAARGAASVFGVILGTGCGGGVVLGGRLARGPNGCAGEWGHIPLPWPEPDEMPGPICWCGRRGCMEAWVSGPALAADHARTTGTHLDAAAIAAKAGGDEGAAETLSRHVSRLGRGLAVVVDLFDPEVIVIGGGLSNLAHLYERLPGEIARHVFSAKAEVTIRPPAHGDASGVRGAARLWNAAADPTRRETA